MTDPLLTDGKHYWYYRLGLHCSGAQQEALQEEGVRRQLQVLIKEVALCQDQVDLIVKDEAQEEIKRATSDSSQQSGFSR
jgi:hypothetical protein